MITCLKKVSMKGKTPYEKAPRQCGSLTHRQGFFFSGTNLVPVWLLPNLFFNDDHFLPGLKQAFPQYL